MTRSKKNPDYPSTSAWKYITIDEYCKRNAHDDLCSDRETGPVLETDPCPETGTADPVDTQ